MAEEFKISDLLEGDGVDFVTEGRKITVHTINVVKSVPPSGKYKVIGLYVDPLTNKLVVQYDDVPVP